MGKVESLKEHHAIHRRKLQASKSGENRTRAKESDSRKKSEFVTLDLVAKTNEICSKRDNAMKMDTQETACAIPDRASWEVLHRQMAFFSANPKLTEALERDRRGVAVLNSFRQVVYCNSAFLGMIRQDTADEVYSLRPGEVFGCVNAVHSQAGCGSSKLCSLCNIYHVIREIESGVSSAVHENLHVTGSTHDEVIALKVTGTPLKTREGVFALLFFSFC